MNEETLEDRAFGRYEVSQTAQGRGWSETTADYMLPLMSTIILVIILSWSTCKTIEYHELIQGSPKNRKGVLLFNGMVVVVAVTVVVYTVHRGAITQNSP